MFRQYVRVGLKNIRKNKEFSILNLIGLALGLASMMCLFSLVHHYYTTDRFHENHDRIYFLKTFSEGEGSYSQTPFPLLYQIQKSCPEVEAATHWQTWDFPWLQYKDAEVQGNTIYVDSGFFEVFSFSLKEGNESTALDEKYSAVISQKIASQLFGNEPALGKSIIVSDSVPLTITGVLEDIPTNSSLRAEVLLSLQLLHDNNHFTKGADWYNTFAENYLLLKEGADPRLLDKKIDQIVKKYYPPEQRQNQVKTVSLSQLKTEGDPIVGTIIKGALAAGVFLILVMLANLLNFNMAMMFSRVKEIAIRRMIGSGRGSIIRQLCVENILLVFASLGLGFFLFTQIFMPQVNKIIGKGFGEVVFQWQKDGLILALFVAVALLIAVVAGSIPAWYLTSVKVSEAVKGKVVKADAKGWLRSVFITLQFSLAVVLIGVAIMLNSQISFMKKASPGFTYKDVVVVNLDLAFKDQIQANRRFESILHSLMNNPKVKSISTTPVIPTKYWGNYNTYIDLESGKEIHVRHLPSDAGYAETYQIPIVAGRNFDDRLSATENQSVLLNQTAVNAFGWSDPIGKQIKGKGSEEVVTVIGVLEDFHYDALQKPIEPLLHWYTGHAGIGYNKYLSIRLDPQHQQEIMAKLERDFYSMPSRRSFSYSFMEDLVEEQYSLMEGLLKVTNFVAFLTILIAGMGLFGLVAFFSRQREKEIGVRKVLGASVLDIATLLSKDFIKLVLLAVLLATPLAWFAMDSWLQDFAYRIQISWWYFAAAGLLALIIALLTVSVQAIKAALANPVKNIRTE